MRGSTVGVRPEQALDFASPGFATYLNGRNIAAKKGTSRYLSQPLNMANDCGSALVTFQRLPMCFYATNSDTPDQSSLVTASRLDPCRLPLVHKLACEAAWKGNSLVHYSIEGPRILVPQRQPAYRRQP